MTKTDEQKGQFKTGSGKGLGVGMGSTKAKNPTLTPRQEKFCQCIVQGLNQSDALRAAYSTDNLKATTINRNAKTLMDDSKISARIKELSAPAIAAVGVTVQNVLENIIRIGNKAEESERYADALKGQELLGKHLKMFTDQMLVGGTGTPIEIVVQFKKPGDK